MSVGPHDLLYLARSLQGSEPDESFQRGATSRAYYAALHATDLTFTSADRVGSESSHTIVIDGARIYGRGPNPGRYEATQVAQFLAKLKRNRIDADYFIDTDYTANRAVTAIATAERILQLCDIVQQRRDQANG